MEEIKKYDMNWLLKLVAKKWAKPEEKERLLAELGRIRKKYEK